MILFSIVFLLSALILAFILLLRSRTGFERILYVSLISTLIAAEIVLYAVYAGEEMYLDVALVFALLGFMVCSFFPFICAERGIYESDRGNPHGRRTFYHALRYSGASEKSGLLQTSASVFSH